MLMPAYTSILVQATLSNCSSVSIDSIVSESREHIPRIHYSCFTGLLANHNTYYYSAVNMAIA